MVVLLRYCWQLCVQVRCEARNLYVPILMYACSCNTEQANGAHAVVAVGINQHYLVLLRAFHNERMGWHLV